MLGRPVEPCCESSIVRSPPVSAGCVTPQARGVGLVGSAIVARVVIHIAAHKNAQRIAIMLSQQQRVLAVDIAWLINRPALRWSFLYVAVGSQHAGCGEQTPRAAFGFSQQVFVERAFPSVA